jgi:RND family efflux transporter MFP subunit
MAWAARKRRWWIVALVAAIVMVGALTFRGRILDSSLPQAVASDPAADDSGSEPVVDVLHPIAGGIPRTTVQPGSAHSFQSADLFAKQSGYLKTQAVDIGSLVKHGDLLAELDVPELVEELERDKAQLRQAEAEVQQAEAGIVAATAERKAAEAYVVQTQASVKRCQSERQFREKQYRRIQELHSLNSIEARLVDEALDQMQAAESAELAAESTVVTAQQQVAAAAARVGRAEADLSVAKAKMQVSQATVKRTSVLVAYTKITSPYDGIVTRRSFHPGDFILAADHGGEVPLLSVDRIDRIRMVVLVPDRDVPYVQAGDPAIVLFDALPDMKFNGKVARVAGSENPQTRTMRVEIDVPNTQGLIRDGMYGQVEIELEKRLAGVRIPSACLAGDSKAGSSKVFVVRHGKAYLVDVKIGKDTGALVEIESGLTAADEVVVKPPATLADGIAVQAEPAAGAAVAAH